MKPIAISDFTLRNVTAQALADGTCLNFAEGGTLSMPFTCEGSWLVVDLTAAQDASAKFAFNFTAGDGRRVGFVMGTLPRLRTRIALPFSSLDGSILFLPRTPGKLKTVTQGHALPVADVAEFSIWAQRGQSLIIHDMYLSDEEPDYPLPDMKMVDALGQKRITDWPGKTHSEAELCEFLRAELAAGDTGEFSDRSPYGGTKSITFEPTGFFALRHDGRRWWLADPDGCAFFSMGLDCVNAGDDCNLTGIESLCEELPDRDSLIGRVGWKREHYFGFHEANLARAFGENWYESWRKLTAARLNNWGFNTIACWSDLRNARAAKVPYTYIFRGFPRTEKRLWRDFPDVFAPEYAETAKEWAAQIAPLKDDPYLLGYFLGNEPTWAFVNELNLAKVLLEERRELVSFAHLTAFLQRKYGEIAALNAAWRTDFASFDAIAAPAAYTDAATADLWAFTAEMIREFVRVPSEAIRAIDPNHLNLGIRYAWLSSDVLASGSEFVDVFSFNCYQMDPTKSIDDFVARVKKPVIIGEFHFGALDRGMDATGLRGVTSQAERGAAYRRYMQSAAAHPMCLGAHYFILNDQSYLGRFDGENYQIGIVDVCNRPYAEFVEGIKATHHELYDIAAGRMEPNARKAEEIPAVAY
ncbi:MAG: beta-galactosidase [Clostridia bacterium]|nr:beta-galactosidase [Clostridia bacterium]